MVMKMYTSTDDMQRKKIPLNVLGHVNDDKLKVATLGGPAQRRRQTAGLLLPHRLRGPRCGTSLSWTFCRTTLRSSWPRWRVRTHLFDAVLQFITVRFMSAEKAAEVEAFFQVNPFPATP